MTERPKPVRGERFERAARLPIEGRKRRRLLALLAAYADASLEPSVNQLATTLKLDPRKIDALLDALERDGWIRVEWAGTGRPGRRSAPGRRNRYELGDWAREPATAASEATSR